MSRIKKNINITVRYSEHLLDIPCGKKILFLDGEYDDDIHNTKNRDFGKSINYGLLGKLAAMERIFPHIVSPEEAKDTEEYHSSFYNFRLNTDNLTPLERQREKIKLRHEYHRKLSQYYSNTLKCLKLTFHKDEVLTLEYFYSIMASYGYPEYIIVSDYFTYEHLPSEGEPKEIKTSEGIIESWDIGGITIIYIPLCMNIEESQIELWHQVLSEIFI